MSFADELTLYIKTGAPLLFVSALETERALLTIQEACKEISSVKEASINVWRNTSGWNEEETADGGDPGKVCSDINDNFPDNSVCILINFHWYLGSPPGPRLYWDTSPSTAMSLVLS